jgi:hypothetical protein
MRFMVSSATRADARDDLTSIDLGQTRNRRSHGIVGRLRHAAITESAFDRQRRIREDRQVIGIDVPAAVIAISLGVALNIGVVVIALYLRLQQ